MLGRIHVVSDPYKRSGNYSHHIVEKTVAADAYGDQPLSVRKVHSAYVLGVFPDFQVINRPDRRFCLGMCRAVARKIMLPDQILCAGLHSDRIERKINEMRISPQHGIGVIAVKNVVFICFYAVRMARMKAPVDLVAFADHDISRKNPV